MLKKIFVFVCILGFSIAFPSGLKGESLEKTMVVDGIERQFRIYLPFRNKAYKKFPILIALHGGGGNGRIMENHTTKRCFDRIADREGLIVVYPSAYKRHWNDGRNDFFANSVYENVNDVKFISKLIDYMAENFNADKDKVYIAGISNGGMMSFRLGCELAGKIKAMAVVSASMPEKLYLNCFPKEKISVLIMHGTKDPIIPWDGGYVEACGKERGRVVSIEKSLNFWVKFNNCVLKKKKEYLPDLDPNDGTRVWKKEYENKEGVKVVLYAVEGGGHKWPGGSNTFPLLTGTMTHDINACEIIWNFLKSLQK